MPKELWTKETSKKGNYGQNHKFFPVKPEIFISTGIRVSLLFLAKYFWRVNCQEGTTMATGLAPTVPWQSQWNGSCPNFGKVESRKLYNICSFFFRFEGLSLRTCIHLQVPPHTYIYIYIFIFIFIFIFMYLEDTYICLYIYKVRIYIDKMHTHTYIYIHVTYIMI